MAEEKVYTKELLKELQSMSLFEKIEMTKDRIEDWYMTYHGNVFVSFSGGKDSTVLLHLVRSMYPDVPAVFSDTGLEYPELKAFVREHDNVTVIRPKMTFSEVITKYGYPLVSKEVAEAIYYARRILPEDKPDGVVEREREREARNKRAEMLGLRSKDSSRTTEPSWDPHDGAERLEREREPSCGSRRKGCHNQQTSQPHNGELLHQRCSEFDFTAWHRTESIPKRCTREHQTAESG